jgi:hypothetical protein
MKVLIAQTSVVLINLVYQIRAHTFQVVNVVRVDLGPDAPESAAAQ